MSDVPAPALRLAGVRRHFGAIRAVDGVDLEVRDGEFFALLGPSGSGKTTCLRLVAGFEEPDAGQVELHGVPARGLPPYERDVNTVFQDYALFPHMSVEENVGYGLRVRKVPAAERKRRVAEMLELVRLPDVGARKPSELSGGQRQRVALARALVNHPRLLLLDEPLGALDLKLRQQMQTELVAIQKRVGITFVHVTHDQEEALALADRLAVFNRGRVEQVGTPEEVYERPASAFVADFVGISNIAGPELAHEVAGSSPPFSIRPEKIRLLAPDAAAPGGSCSLRGEVAEVVYLGSHTRYVVALSGGARFQVMDLNRDAIATTWRPGQATLLSWQPEHARPLAG